MSAPANQFGRYELVDRIAAGGMAELFRARYEPAPGVSKQVVIKRILPSYAANRAFVAMFTNEAKIAMGLSHGNIAQVFDFGAIDGEWFLAMELVDGHALSKVLRRLRAMGFSSMPLELAVYVVVKVLEGLHYAHTRLDEDGKPLKIVHLDVSPQNVLLSFEGQVKLVDFGIARARNAGPEDTGGSTIKGKYSYFSPEQAKNKELDARTDVFATGVMLYELLTGQLPFPGRLTEALAAIVKGEFKKPRELNPRIPVAVEKVVLKALANERADRYPTAEAFQYDLARALKGNAPEATAATLSQLLHFAFEEELVKEGRPVQLSRDFLEQAREWTQPAPLERDDEPATEVVPIPRPKRPSPAKTWGVVLTLLALTGGVGLMVMNGGARARTEPSVNEPGPPAPDAAPPPTLMPAAQPDVTLDPIAVVTPEAPPPPVDQVEWPQAKFALDVTRHRLDLGRAGATKVTLDPRKRSRVALLGNWRLPGWAYYVVSDGGAHAGVFGRDPLAIREASALFVFHVPERELGMARRDQTAPRGLLVTTDRRVRRFKVPPNLAFTSSHRLTVTGLDSARRYELVPSADAPPSVRSKGDPVHALLLGSALGVSVAPLGQPTRLTGVRSFWVTALDDLADVETGQVWLQLRELP